jgi:AbrB family transcriptional regulator, transcriptional pleiotropic regulator of transition state genes
MISAAQGVVRRIDDLGRVVIPSEYRKVLGIQLGDHLDMTLEGTGIVLRRIEPSCVFCQSFDGLKPFMKRPICTECRRRIATGEGA